MAGKLPFTIPTHLSTMRSMSLIYVVSSCISWSTDGQAATPITLGAGGMTTVRRAVETLTRALQSTSTIRIRSDAEHSSFTISSNELQSDTAIGLDIDSMLLSLPRRT